MTPSQSLGIIRILHLEDDPRDAALLRRHLEKAGFSPQVTVVSGEAEFLRALRSKPFDIILTDYSLPNWSGLGALELLHQEGCELPCILVSGTTGEEAAVECIKKGATDYVLKDRPARLAVAVERALREKLASDRRKQIEQSRDRLALIVESSEDAIIGFAPDGLILSWNRAASRIFGYSSQEVNDKPLTLLFASKFVPQVQNALERLLRGENPDHFQAAGISKDGRAIDLAVTMSAILEPNGTVAGGSVIIRDITERCRLEEQLRHSQKMEAVGRLAGGVAHDFNNLLTVILGYTSMLEKRLGSGDPLCMTVAEIRKAAEYAALLTAQLLTFSRKQISEQRVIDLNNLVLGMQSMVQRLMGADIELRVSMDASLGLVQADAGQLNQVIMNLVVNARDSMPKGGKIIIETRASVRERDDASGNSARPPGRYATVTLTDTGSGMSAETLAHIFEPFFTTKEPGKGTGLGLSTSYGIIEQHRGWIEVSSQVDHGTSIKVSLPEAPPEALAAVFAERRPETGTRTGTILLVEDQAPLRMLAEVVLTDRGHRVLVAGNGAAALELASSYKETIDLLVTDVVMPKMSGPELAALLNQSHPNTVVLYISGYNDQNLQTRGLIETGSAFLQKPFLPEALIHEVDKLLAVRC
jgi:two-component system cell cycle sensor histidine kinase/response regulator CckA